MICELLSKLLSAAVLALWGGRHLGRWEVERGGVGVGAHRLSVSSSSVMVASPYSSGVHSGLYSQVSAFRKVLGTRGHSPVCAAFAPPGELSSFSIIAIRGSKR